MLFTEWSLVFFTVLAQTAIGMLLVSEIVFMRSNSPVGKALSRQLPIVTLLTGASLFLSLTHLGTPLHSVYTILNAGSSWLSREILVISAFFVSVLALTIVRRKSPESKATGLSVIAMLLGLSAVYVMSRVYMLQTVPVWDTASTMLGFYGTMLVTGAITGGLIFAMQGKSVPELDGETRNEVIRFYLIASVIGLGMKFIGIPLDIIALAAVDNLGVSGIELLSSGGSFILIARTVLTFMGTAVFGWMAYRSLSSKPNLAMTNAGFFAFGLVFAGEIVGRLVFYGTYLRIGL